MFKTLDLDDLTELGAFYNGRPELAGFVYALALIVMVREG